MTKTLPNVANPHIRIYREIGKQVLASIEMDRHTHTQTDVIELYIRYQHYVQLIVIYISTTMILYDYLIILAYYKIGQPLGIYFLQLSVSIGA